MFLHLRPESDLSVRDDEFPLGGVFDMVAWGIVFAAIPIALATYGLFHGNPPWPLKGTQFDSVVSHNIATCIAFIAIGAYAHFHYFWGILKNRMAFMLGRKLAVSCIGCCLAFVVIDIVRRFLSFA